MILFHYFTEPYCVVERCRRWRSEGNDIESSLESIVLGLLLYSSAAATR